MPDCIFCKIIRGEIPCTKVYDEENVLGFMDIQPINEGHVLIVPKRHSVLISDVDNDVLSKMMIAAKTIDNALRKSGLKCEDVNLLLSDGPSAGQEVSHVHLHVIPRFKADEFAIKTNRIKFEESQLIESAEKIKKFII